MARRSTGQVVTRKRKDRIVYAIRFYAGRERHYVTLGSDAECWNRRRAEDELASTMASVRAGTYEPPRPTAPIKAQAEEPTFHEFASEWFEGVAPGLRERTQVDYRWRLSSHLLPYFASHRLSAITVEEVDRYRRSKERERDALRAARTEQLALPQAERKRLPRPLANSSINKTIRLLAVILEQAVEYGYIDRNTAQGRKRLLRESRPSRSYLQPDQVAALLSAAGELDAQARSGDTGRRRPLLATLALGGLRITEALELRWRDVSLADRKLRVVEAKTGAGVREVNLTPTVQEVLSEYRTRTRHDAEGDLVFPTGKGRPDSPSNVRTRFLAKAVQRANDVLQESGREPIVGVTPHSLRRTFISLLLATGADVPYVMAQAGHTDPKTTLGIYAQVIASKTDHGAALDGLVEASDWAPMGTGRPIRVAEGAGALRP
jgi:integrase